MGLGRASGKLSFLCRETLANSQAQRSDPLNDNKNPSEGLKAHPLHSHWGRRLCLRASQVVRVVKKLPANAGDIRDSGSIPRWGRFPVGEPTATPPVFLPAESRGQRSLAGYSPWGHKD